MRFWSWRVLYETLIHRLDAELALGRTPVVSPEIAADGVEEFLTNVVGHPLVADRLREFGHAGETLHLHATDGEGEWMLTLGADGTTWAHGHGKGSAAVRGTTADLLLLVWGRHEVGDRFEVFGDEALLTGWLAAASR